MDEDSPNFDSSTDDEPDPPPDANARRSLLEGNNTYELYDRDLHLLEKHGDWKKRSIDVVDAAGNDETITWKQPSYYGSGQWAAGSDIFNHAFDFMAVDDCGNVYMTRTGGLTPGRVSASKYFNSFDSIVLLTDFPAGHIMEGQTIPMFLTDRNKGRLPTGALSKYSALSSDWLITYWNRAIVTNANPRPGGRNSPVPSARISEALGSKVNTRKFVLLLQTVNQFKASVSYISRQGYAMLYVDSCGRTMIQ